MLARTWRCRIVPERAAEYERFARDVSLPMFEGQPGFRGVLMARDSATCTVTTLWDDARAVERLEASPDYCGTVEAIRASRVVAEELGTRLAEVHLALMADGARALPWPAGPTGPDGRDARMRASYDAIASRYARAITPIDRKPLDLAQIERFLHGLPEGPVWDLGCGPGDATRVLRRRRNDVTGWDLSPGMIHEARAADPGGRYEVGDMTALPVPATPLAGLTAFYSLIHVPPDRVAATLRGWLDLLRPGGLLLLAVHEGATSQRLATMLGEPVDLDFHFFAAEELAAVVAAQGFSVEHLDLREPDPAIEAPTRRITLTARRSWGSREPRPASSGGRR